ncbi:MAG: c-type cytochrome domain-containing protein [Verrucomicrobiota bacterium]|nr:c-type cytochrome domain-containing protein [Verrucomicrobiota bacterium]
MRRFSIVPLFIALILNNESVARSLNYQEKIFPLLEVYCLDCHSDDKAEADVNFDNFRTIQDIKKDPKAWIKVDRMLSSRQMPPRDSDQPSKNDREVLSEWVQSFLMDEAKARAGDPGRVVLRWRINH